jgi:hypothetical protein
LLEVRGTSSSPHPTRAATRMRRCSRSWVWWR